LKHELVLKPQINSLTEWKKDNYHISDKFNRILTESRQKDCVASIYHILKRYL